MRVLGGERGKKRLLDDSKNEGARRGGGKRRLLDDSKNEGARRGEGEKEASRGF